MRIASAQAAGLFDPRPQQSQRAEFCHRQKLIASAQAAIDHALRIFQRNTGISSARKIGDTGREHERQLLYFDPPASWITRPSAAANDPDPIATRPDRTGDRGATMSGQA